MKFKLYELKQMAESFNKLIQQDLPISISWSLMEIAEVFVENEEKYNKLSKKIWEKHSTEVEGKFVVLNEKLKAFKKEMEELNNIEFEIEFNKINIDVLKPHIKLSALDLIKLKKILDK